MGAGSSIMRYAALQVHQIMLRACSAGRLRLAGWFFFFPAGAVFFLTKFQYKQCFLALQYSITLELDSLVQISNRISVD